ncbi:hypothetical protein EVG20_g2376 [Dentipellis fragilis]|uniref:Uncharacterized protein n=1 Tax=Dentipellis fragilis TaxID=205917 RepID=A0A4Y9Z9E9_9AGAM|nr:hypothetical protein EVG20_g2376 [Dentipellis fragilis]
MLSVSVTPSAHYALRHSLATVPFILPPALTMSTLTSISTLAPSESGTSLWLALFPPSSSITSPTDPPSTTSSDTYTPFPLSSDNTPSPPVISVITSVITYLPVSSSSTVPSTTSATLLPAPPTRTIKAVQTSQPPATTHKYRLSSGELAGIVIAGTVIFIGWLAIAIFYIHRRREMQKNATHVSEAVTSYKPQSLLAYSGYAHPAVTGTTSGPSPSWETPPHSAALSGGHQEKPPI